MNPDPNPPRNPRWETPDPPQARQAPPGWDEPVRTNSEPSIFNHRVPDPIPPQWAPARPPKKPWYEQKKYLIPLLLFLGFCVLVLVAPPVEESAEAPATTVQNPTSEAPGPVVSTTEAERDTTTSESTPTSTTLLATSTTTIAELTLDDQRRLDQLLFTASLDLLYSDPGGQEDLAILCEGRDQLDPIVNRTLVEMYVTDVAYNPDHFYIWTADDFTDAFVADMDRRCP